MRIETEINFEVDGHGELPLTVSGEVELTEEPTVTGLEVEGWYEHPKSGRDIELDAGDLTKKQLADAECELIRLAEALEGA